MRAISLEEVKNIIGLIRNGFIDNNGKKHKANKEIAFALNLQSNLGLRIGDVLKLTINDIVLENNRYHLKLVETKTKKLRTFTVPTEIYNYMRIYQLENGIKDNEPLIKTSVRNIQKILKYATETLGLEEVSTHSFRKYFATTIYMNNSYDIRLVQELLQHSDISTTQRYVGVSSQRIESAIMNHTNIV